MATIRWYVAKNIYIKMKDEPSKVIKYFCEVLADDLYEYFIDEQPEGVFIIGVEKSTGRICRMWEVVDKIGNHRVVEWLKNCGLKKWDVYRKYYDKKESDQSFKKVGVGVEIE